MLYRSIKILDHIFFALFFLYNYLTLIYFSFLLLQLLIFLFMNLGWHIGRVFLTNNLAIFFAFNPSCQPFEAFLPPIFTFPMSLTYLSLFDEFLAINFCLLWFYQLNQQTPQNMDNLFGVFFKDLCKSSTNRDSSFVIQKMDWSLLQLRIALFFEELLRFDDDWYLCSSEFSVIKRNC